MSNVHIVPARCSAERLAEIARLAEGATDWRMPEFDYDEPMEYKDLRNAYVPARSLAIAVPDLLGHIAELEERIEELESRAAAAEESTSFWEQRAADNQTDVRRANKRADEIKEAAEQAERLARVDRAERGRR